MQQRDMDFDLDKKSKLTIGRLARETGLNVTTIRYYQQRGLLRRPERPLTGSFRSYGEGDIDRLQLIKRTQELGFTLAEIAELLTHVADGKCHEIRALADKRLQALKTQIKLLERKRKTLAAMLAGCNPDDCTRCQLINELRTPTPMCGKA